MRVADVKELRGRQFDQRPNRLIVPLGDFGDEIPDTTFGAVSDFVTDFSDRVRIELNEFAPEMVVWWSAPTFPYGPARLRKHDQAMLGLMPNKWLDVVGGLVDAGLDWCDRVILICSTAEQAQILRENIPLLREFGRNVVFCFVPPQDITERLLDELMVVFWDNQCDSFGEYCAVT